MEIEQYDKQLRKRLVELETEKYLAEEAAKEKTVQTYVSHNG